jgi:hypothetical protein
LCTTAKNTNTAKKESDKKKAKSPKMQLTSDPITSESNRDAKDIVGSSSASRDTLLDYGYFSSASNSCKVNGSGSRLSTTNSAMTKPVSSNSKLLTTSPAVPKAAGSISRASTSPAPVKTTSNIKSKGQKSLEAFSGFGKTSNHAKKEQSNDQLVMNEEKSNSTNNDALQNSTPVSNDSSPTHPSTQQLQDRIALLEQQLTEATSQNLAIKNNQTMLTLQLQATVKRQSLELQQMKSESQSRMTNSMNVIEKLIRDESLRKSAELRQKLASDGARLGRLVTTRSRGGIQRSIESWEDGEEPMKLKTKKEELKRRRERLEKRWGELTRQSDGMIVEEDASNADRPVNDLEMFEAKETVWMHLEELKREERKLDEEDRMLTMEKRKHVRTLKLVANEDSSKFRFRNKVSL